jgi:hypothetical protein
VEDDFDLTKNMFSYTPLKELAAKVPGNSFERNKKPPDDYR